MLTRKFKEQFTISFDPFMQEKECLVNATEMANVFGKKVKDFLKTDKTKAFLEVLEEQIGNQKKTINNTSGEDTRPLQSEKNDENEDEIGADYSDNILKVSRGGNQGTWMHQYLAIDFAMWLDPYFKFWVITVIEEILFGHARRRDQSFKRTIEIKERMGVLKAIVNPTGENFTEYVALEDSLKDEKTGRTKITTERIKEIQSLIFTETQMSGKETTT